MIIMLVKDNKSILKWAFLLTKNRTYVSFILN